jgi:hypothetical protein
LLEVVLADLTMTLGPHHPDSLWARRELAATLIRCERQADAIREATNTLTDTIRVMGQHHQYTTWMEAVCDAIRVNDNCDAADREFGCERILWE